VKKPEWASKFILLFCGECPNAHLVFFDQNEEPIVQATMTYRQAKEIADKIKSKDPNFKELSK
jgi:hypothetical protein